MHKLIEAGSYVGRFAPSPSGDLHFGSLIAAVASFLQARSQSGKWLIRIEDIDPPREIEGSANRILLDLKRFGMEADEPVLYQSSQLKQYLIARDSLFDSGYAFNCSCSRKSLPASGIYPGICRYQRPVESGALSVRLKTGTDIVSFSDRLLGEISEDLSRTCGDFVIWRTDKLPAYQLAVVVADAIQGVTEVVRGADLLDSSCRQIYLQRLLNFPTPAYVHLPVATVNGSKLGKRLSSDPIANQDPVLALSSALEFLGHRPPPDHDLGSLWEWAIEHWSIQNIPARRSIPVDDVSGFQS